MRIRSTVALVFFLLFTITLTDTIQGAMPKMPKSKKDDSMFSSFFNMFGAQDKQEDKQQNKQFQQTGEGRVVKDGKIYDEKQFTRTIFKGLGGLNKVKKQLNGDSEKKDPTAQMFEALDRIQTDLIAPRRRGPSRIQKDSNLQRKQHKKKEKDHKKNNFAMLNQFLKELELAENVNKIQWENPTYKNDENGQSVPFYKIFGEKKKGKSKHAYVDKVVIEQMIRKKVPFLSQGSIINMVSTSYRNGILLKIDYLNMDEITLEQKIYVITAKYRPKYRQLDIISMKESDTALVKDGNVIFEDLEGSSSQSKEESKKDIKASDKNKKQEQKGDKSKQNKEENKVVGDNQPAQSKLIADIPKKSSEQFVKQPQTPQNSDLREVEQKNTISKLKQMIEQLKKQERQKVVEKQNTSTDKKVESSKEIQTPKDINNVKKVDDVPKEDSEATKQLVSQKNDAQNNGNNEQKIEKQTSQPVKQKKDSNQEQEQSVKLNKQTIEKKLDSNQEHKQNEQQIAKVSLQKDQDIKPSQTLNKDEQKTPIPEEKQKPQSTKQKVITEEKPKLSEKKEKSQKKKSNKIKRVPQDIVNASNQKGKTLQKGKKSSKTHKKKQSKNNQLAVQKVAQKQEKENQIALDATTPAENIDNKTSLSDTKVDKKMDEKKPSLSQTNNEINQKKQPIAQQNEQIKEKRKEVASDDIQDSEGKSNKKNLQA